MSTFTTPQALFPDFYGSVVVKALADAKRWTISGRIGDEDRKGKAPVDVRHLIDAGRLRGAFEISPTCLVDLDELTRAIPNAANHAFYLQAQIDGLMVVDIEPECPEEMAAELLALPGILYSELSMSGQGYHLVTLLPKNLHDFPAAVGKRVLREGHGWYELLLDHWVTFTRRPISELPMIPSDGANSVTGFSSVEDLYASLATAARPSKAFSTIVRTDAEAPKIIGGDQIVERTVEGAQPRFKKLDHFDCDKSRWEFSILGVLHREMRKHLVVVGFLKRTTYTASDESWLLYRAALEVLPPRPKHRERRNGRDYLLDRAATMVALNS